MYILSFHSSIMHTLKNIQYLIQHGQELLKESPAAPLMDPRKIFPERDIIQRHCTGRGRRLAIIATAATYRGIGLPQPVI